MTNQHIRDAVKGELDRLSAGFFRAVSFEAGEAHMYQDIRSLFIAAGLLIKNSGPEPEVSSIDQFIGSRQAMVDAGEMTRFHEGELSDMTEIFGNISHRFSAYEKAGIIKGVPFETQGMISTQFILTPAGWRMSAMAWDDERPGLSIPG